MRVALIAPPFIPVPPKVYGGTELFIANLVQGLQKLAIDTVVYSNGDSTVAGEKRWLYPHSQWPVCGEVYANLKDINHTAWAIRDAAQDCDLVHLNNLAGLAISRYMSLPFVYTVHHPQQEELSDFYKFYPCVNYVTISHFQRHRETMPHTRTIHHGIDLSFYRLRPKKQQYLSFLGRIAPIKGTHLAIQIARESGIPLKIGGEVQPLFRDYFEREVKPHIDGKFIEYIGEVDLESKNELLGNSLAMLFPIQWDEPFGLVMVEAMACGTPVLALPGGAVGEVVKDGVSGWIGRSVHDLARRATRLEKDFVPAKVRDYVARHFSLERMALEYVTCYREALNRGIDSEFSPGSGRERAIA